MQRVTLGAVFAFGLSGLGAVVCAQTTHTVNLSGASFTPNQLTIDVGDTVRWVWLVLGGLHDVKSGTSGTLLGDGKFSSGDPVFPPMQFEVTFDQAFLDANPITNDVYPYYCSVHFFFGMTGTITVIRLGDLDRNGRIDLADHGILSACFGGPGATTPPVGCTTQQFEAADIDGDKAVDLKDFAVLQQAFSG